MLVKLKFPYMISKSFATHQNLISAQAAFHFIQKFLLQQIKNENKLNFNKFLVTLIKLEFQPIHPLYPIPFPPTG